MKGLSNTFDFGYTTGNDEMQTRTKVSLLIHYAYFLIHLEITNTPSRAP